jgi:hypothetical protein
VNLASSFNISILSASDHSINESENEIARLFKAEIRRSVGERRPLFTGSATKSDKAKATVRGTSIYLNPTDRHHTILINAGGLVTHEADADGMTFCKSREPAQVGTHEADADILQKRP